MAKEDVKAHKKPKAKKQPVIIEELDTYDQRKDDFYLKALVMRLRYLIILEKQPALTQADAYEYAGRPFCVSARAVQRMFRSFSVVKTMNKYQLRYEIKYRDIIMLGIVCINELLDHYEIYHHTKNEVLNFILYKDNS